ncbi:NDP-hexose 2,3-dehydratase family protein [Streptomyces sp. NPDC020965]|uniref:NDP-hexose 2,3-dehydratase family protein n=1 Tax=Streptomyces sp. NPDC020965 TaxID=3365105 RepID=UPI0037B73B25
MTETLSTLPPTHTGDESLAVRIAKSVSVVDDGALHSLDEFHDWFAARGQRTAHVERVPLDELTGWSSDPVTGNIGHDSGKFFSVQGLSVELPGAPVPAWAQPIINQPEIGILGILIKEFNGVLHCLMQAKLEPGNRNGLQLSPTVQATRSNYTRVHQGNPVPYVGYFQDTSANRVITDALQSEQGSWFYQKRNRNMVVETEAEIEQHEAFMWLTIGQLHRLLAIDDLINMDTRTVLSCLPFSGAQLAEQLPGTGGDLRMPILRSCSEDQGSLHTTGDLLSWITDARTRNEVRTRLTPLRDVAGWRRTPDAITHDTGRFFDVMAVRIETDGDREVRQWTQPMIAPAGIGIVAFLVKRIDGVLHVLAHARVEPGYLDVVELSPTVMCTPGNYEGLPAAARPPFLGEVLSARPEQVRFETILSEEGGRFYHAQNRYIIVESDIDVAPELSSEYRWMALHQMVGLLRHSHYVNVQARSLIACLHSLSGAQGRN